MSYRIVDNVVPLVDEFLGVQVGLAAGQGDGVVASRNVGGVADQLLNVDVGGVVDETQPDSNALALDAGFHPPLEGEEGDSPIVLLVVGDFLHGPSSEFRSSALFPSLAGGGGIDESWGVDELVDVGEDVGARRRHGQKVV